MQNYIADQQLFCDQLISEPDGLGGVCNNWAVRGDKPKNRLKLNPLSLQRPVDAGDNCLERS
ncbi:MAG: hypothetical protein ABI705_06930, partial [Aestuariivirga sp.]